MQTCYLVGSSPDVVRIDVRPGDYVIAADGGERRLAEWGIVPDLIIGNMDSLPQDSPPNSVLLIRHSTVEDYHTGLTIAFAEGFNRGMRSFVITGADGGGRVDHSMANLQLLVRAAELGAFAVLRGKHQCLTVLMDNGELRLTGNGNVSVFAYGGDATGVTVRGMRHEMENKLLRDSTPRGVDNYLDNGEGLITMESGVLVVFWETSGIDVIEYFVNI